MRRGTDIVIGTPGRVLDLMNTRELLLDQVTHFVLDEGDQMLDLGFIRDIRTILRKLPAQRQSMLFSATMPMEIGQLAAPLLRDPVRVEVKAGDGNTDKIEQHVYFADARAKKRLLVNLLRDPAMARVIVFTRTKRGADKVAEHLQAAGINSDAMHGNKSQNARQRILDRFKSGEARVLVATDLAARGIHVTGITHVVNYELPNEPESYVHRIGRTARAGASGIAYAFCDPSERGALRAIEPNRRHLAPAGERPTSGYSGSAASVPRRRPVSISPSPPSPTPGGVISAARRQRLSAAARRSFLAGSDHGRDGGMQSGIHLEAGRAEGSAWAGGNGAVRSVAARAQSAQTVRFIVAHYSNATAPYFEKMAQEFEKANPARPSRSRT